MSIVEMTRISDGKKFRGFVDWDGMTRNLNFYYYDESLPGWTSEKLGAFKPESPQPEKVIGE